MNHPDPGAEIDAEQALTEAPGLARMPRPCIECPWRRDAEPGKFSPVEFARMRATVEQPPGGFTGDLGDLPPVFACHMAAPTAKRESVACAGALAVCGLDNLTIRLGLALGRVPPEAVAPGAGWPALFASFEEMTAANAHRPPADQ
jgi:hypothetical protein